MTKATVPKEKILPLCLYLIEREFHFTGDGIWTEAQIEER